MNTGFPACHGGTGFAMPAAAPLHKQGHWPFGDLRPLSYDLIMADPPWPTKMHSEKGYKKAPEAHYPTMSFDEIAALPVGKLARMDALLVLWGMWSILLEGEYTKREGIPQASFAPLGRIIEAWGATYVTGGSWVKREKSGKLCFGTGYRLRGCTEPFLIAVWGNPETSKSVRGIIETFGEEAVTTGGIVIDAVRRGHSQKPAESYEFCEALMPKALNRLDLFAGDPREGWDRWAPMDHRERE